jgi:hypothetical protein
VCIFFISDELSQGVIKKNSSSFFHLSRFFNFFWLLIDSCLALITTRYCNGPVALPLEQKDREAAELRRWLEGGKAQELAAKDAVLEQKVAHRLWRWSAMKEQKIQPSKCRGQYVL